jgi:UDP-N-acetylglucosamine diphosphorylase / glucose-1-phosphate thymidylyltransferase / UDP-N-acetylgalactosamine diphosphorylase / glucosamine-1-phosphate N-acetyltransferase / galactosamine-1-phosphate N-acetyltransferase
MKPMQAILLPPRNPAFCAPITSNRDLGSCLIGNMPMRELMSAELRRSGMQMVTAKESCSRTLRIPLDHWIELGALLLLGRNPEPAVLLDSHGNTIAWKGADQPDPSFEKIVTDANCFPIIYPWDLLRMNEEVMAMLDETSLLGEVSPLANLTGFVRVGNGSRILPGTVIEGPVIIGPNCQIGPNAYIRGATSIGAHCYVGNGAEVKNSIVYNNTYISRQCYVGDSIIGAHVTLGAGTCTENHRHDGRHHVSIIQGDVVNTGRLKFGAVLGDGVHTGVNTSIEAGVKIGIARTTQAGSYIGKDLL